MKRRVALLIACLGLLIALILITLCGDRKAREGDSTNPAIAGEEYSVPEEDLDQGVWKDRQVTLKIVDKAGKPVAGCEVMHTQPPDKSGAVKEILTIIGTTDGNGEIVWKNPIKGKIKMIASHNEKAHTWKKDVKQKDLDHVIVLNMKEVT